MQFVYAVEQYVSDVAGDQDAAAFHLGGIATEKTSSAVHWYSAEFRGGTPSEVRTPSTQHAALCPALSRPPRLPVPSLYERL